MLKKQCSYIALHHKLSGKLSYIQDAWTKARLAGNPVLHFAKENIKIHRKLERIESKMWWLTKQML